MHVLKKRFPKMGENSKFLKKNCRPVNHAGLRYVIMDAAPPLLQHVRYYLLAKTPDSGTGDFSIN